METIFSQFEISVRKFSPKNAVSFFQQDKLCSWTYRELHEKALNLAAGLAGIGFQKGDRIAILSPNCPEWVLMDLAVARLGGILVPIHTSLPGIQVRTILLKSRVKFFAIGRKDFLESYYSFQDLLPGFRSALLKIVEEYFPTVEKFILMDHREEKMNVREKTYFLSELLEKGTQTRKHHQGNGFPEVLPEETSTILYTSGTTGKIKGAILTHGGIVANALGSLPLAQAVSQDVTLSILPLSHAFERTAGCLLPLFAGAEVVYGRGLHRIMEDLQVVRPTGFVAVPRLLEKVYLGIHGAIRNRSTMASRIFSWALRQTEKYRDLREKNQHSAALYWLPHVLAHRLFYQKILQKFGGRLSRISSGGAPLDPQVSRFFNHVGITVLEGYGLTEASPVVATNPMTRNKIGSVGIPPNGTEIKIGENDEVWVRGPNVMQGYENDANTTGQVLQADGWLRTGDIGFIDEEGYLFIRGRIKELIVTSYGKKIVPTIVETELERSAFIKQVMVYGNERPFLTALIVPDPSAIWSHLEAKHISELENEMVNAIVAQEILRLGSSLSKYEQVKRFALIDEEFNEENGLLTPTLKLKRPDIIQKYQKTLEGLYHRAD